jgi:hypothetical protein
MVTGLRSTTDPSATAEDNLGLGHKARQEGWDQRVLRTLVRGKIVTEEGAPWGRSVLLFNGLLQSVHH